MKKIKKMQITRGSEPGLCNFYDVEKGKECTKTGKERADCYNRRLCPEHYKKYLKILKIREKEKTYF